ncbi:unnamed protein product, partial [Aureobasidium uvarum]
MAPNVLDTSGSHEDMVDVGIRKLVNEINEIDTLATTNSCAGRIVVCLEGRTLTVPPSNLDDNARISGAAEGDGGQALFVSHDPLPLSGKGPVAPMLGLSDHTNLGVPPSIDGVRWVRCRFEPMVGYEGADGKLIPMVTEAYMRVLVELCNERFLTNKQKTEAFREALFARFKPQQVQFTGPSAWEPLEQRRARMKEDGIRRQAETDVQKAVDG